jgi:hypothetical protein
MGTPLRQATQSQRLVTDDRGLALMRSRGAETRGGRARHPIGADETAEAGSLNVRWASGSETTRDRDEVRVRSLGTARQKI